jgi:hypothetical protein
MWHWIVANRAWLFSGVGISILVAGGWFLKKLGLFAPSSLVAAPTSAPIQQTNTNAVIQAPVINVNVPQSSPTPQSTLPPEPKSEFPRVEAKPEEEPDHRPQIRSLPPRITSVREDDDPEEGNGGIVEGGDSLKAVVATFRMKKPSPDGNGTYLTARLSYRTRENILVRDIEREIHRVNYGTWIDEDYNFVKMRITDTKELVLTIQPKGSGVCLAVQDNRHSPDKCNGVAYHKLEPHDGSFFVDVTLVDGKHGPVIGYTYQIDVDPLKVHEIIRVPRL